MMKFLFAALAAFAAVTSIEARMVPMEDNRSAMSDDWRSAGRLAADAVFPMTVAIKTRNQDVVAERLRKSSDPTHAEFSNHMSHEELTALTSPTQESIDAVIEWLASSGITEQQFAKDTSPESGFLSFLVTGAQAENLLAAPFHSYKAAASNADHRRITRVAPGARYLIHESVAQHIDFVAPTVHFPPVHTQRQLDAARLERAVAEKKAQRKLLEADAADSGTLFVVPKWLRQLYQVGDAVGKASTGNSACVASFIGQFYSPADLTAFWKKYSPTLVGSPVHQIGANNYKTKGAGDEASLDVQYLSSVGQGVPLWVWYSGNQETPFLQFVTDVAKTPDSGVPKIFSISYGSYEDGYSSKLINRIDAEMQKLAARGITVFVASGDSGAGGNCTTANETPTYPASSPFVTTVGGVMGGDAGKTPTGEYTDNISGGGFSTVFPRQKYQDAAANQYLAQAKKLPPQGDFNAQGQGYPDLAAQSEGFTIEFDGFPMPFVGGTSCACPTMAGVWSLLNEARMVAGKKPLGFLNPLIYQTGARTLSNSTAANTFNDIVTGNDKGCGDGVGYRATKGWDAATGWGSVNFRKMLPIVMALP